MAYLGEHLFWIKRVRWGVKRYQAWDGVWEFRLDNEVRQTRVLVLSPLPDSQAYS